MLEVVTSALRRIASVIVDCVGSVKTYLFAEPLTRNGEEDYDFTLAALVVGANVAFGSVNKFISGSVKSKFRRIRTNGGGVADRRGLEMEREPSIELYRCLLMMGIDILHVLGFYGAGRIRLSSAFVWCAWVFYLISPVFSHLSFVGACLVVALYVDAIPIAGALGASVRKVIASLYHVAVPTFFLMSGYWLVGHADKSDWWCTAATMWYVSNPFVFVLVSAAVVSLIRRSHWFVVAIVVGFCGRLSRSWLQLSTAGAHEVVVIGGKSP